MDMDLELMKRQMLEKHLPRVGVKDERVLNVMAKIPREKFLPEDYQDFAYADRALPIAEDQTISQPAIVGLMTQLAELTPTNRVLEIGTGSGYQTAILAELAKEVFTIEVRKPLAEEARRRLESLNYKNIHYRIGNGYEGWPEGAPFDVIIVTAAPPYIPGALKDQLAQDGRMIIPVGTDNQELKLLRKTQSGIEEESILPVLFVPMIQQH